MFRTLCATLSGTETVNIIIIIILIIIGKGLELLSANGGRFETNQQLFADDTALVADSD